MGVMRFTKILQREVGHRISHFFAAELFLTLNKIDLIRFFRNHGKCLSDLFYLELCHLNLCPMNSDGASGEQSKAGGAGTEKVTCCFRKLDSPNPRRHFTCS